MAIAAEELEPAAAAGLGNVARPLSAKAKAVYAKNPELAVKRHEHVMQTILNSPAAKKEKARLVAQDAARAARKPKAAASPTKTSESAAPREAGAGGKAISGNFGVVGRVILAFGAFLLALELASYLSGRYFSYSLGKGASSLKGAAQHIDLYPGQSQKIALQKTLPAPSSKAVITL